LFRTADCDTDHYLVVAEVKERWAVNKQTMHRFHTKRFNLKKLNEVEGKEHYHAKISNRFSVWKTWMLRWLLIELWKLLERI
jgi:hypothetical protein